MWLLAIANFFAYIARYSLIDWGPTYLREVKEASLSGGGIGVQTAIEFGGNPSTIFFGWISIALEAGAAWLPLSACCQSSRRTPQSPSLPGGYFSLYYYLFVTIGCFIYPVINLITIAALDIVSKKAIGTAAGFIGLLRVSRQDVARIQMDWKIRRRILLHIARFGRARGQLFSMQFLVCSGIATLLLAANVEAKAASVTENQAFPVWNFDACIILSFSLAAFSPILHLLVSVACAGRQTQPA